MAICTSLQHPERTSPQASHQFQHLPCWQRHRPFCLLLLLHCGPSSRTRREGHVRREASGRDERHDWSSVLEYMEKSAEGPRSGRWRYPGS
ncbi:uncharacterized protein LOC110806649 isoform X2 [Carica papaya]|uniref:uncharacterized protein LOC110806649 isoform X2 n=1 Tax=Carica papaya TaxID=3649 RepID=UPI000B8CFC47|nr:uncharacterized protein LOC110806649 isoform X2 [Carica papaya]